MLPLNDPQARLSRLGFRPVACPEAVDPDARWWVFKVTHEDDEGWWTGLPVGHYPTLTAAADALAGEAAR